MAATHSEASLTVVEVRTCLAFEARTFNGLHVAAIAPAKHVNSPYLSSCISYSASLENLMIYQCSYRSRIIFKIVSQEFSHFVSRKDL